MIRKVYAIPVNPEPWRVPPMSPGRIGRKLIVRSGRDEQSHTFKEAVREALVAQGAEMLPEPYEIHFHFYRQLAVYETAKGSDHTKHWADATNMQKLAEDALQGVLISNDKHVRRVSSHIAEQAPGIEPMIIVFITAGTEPLVQPPLGFSREHIELARERSAKLTTPRPTSNEWPSAEGDF